MPRRAKSKFVDRIQYILDSEGIKQAELARRLGITRATISEWMKGRSKSPRMETPFLIESRLGYSARWVATGEGDPKPRKIDPTDSTIIEALIKLTDPDKKSAVSEFVDYQLSR